MMVLLRHTFYFNSLINDDDDSQLPLYVFERIERKGIEYDK